MRAHTSSAVGNAVQDAVENVSAFVRPVGLPLVGSVAAGQPILAEENIEEYVEVPPVAGGDLGEYVLRIRGESMKDAGILEGDYVVVRKQENAADGDIVVALVGEEATVKRFFREPDHIRLQPENTTMEPIRSSWSRNRLPSTMTPGPSPVTVIGSVAVPEALTVICSR